MKLRDGTALALLILFASAVSASYTATYEITDGKNAIIDLISSILVGIAGQGYDIGDIMGMLILVTILTSLALIALGVPQKIIDFARSFAGKK